MAHQARGIAMHFQDQPIKPTYVLRDGDKKFTAEFCSVLESESLEVKRVGLMAPNMNAYAERWVQAINTECLDHCVVLGEAHLRHIVSKSLAYYHEERPHQAKDNQPLSGNRECQDKLEFINCSSQDSEIALKLRAVWRFMPNDDAESPHAVSRSLGRR